MAFNENSIDPDQMLRSVLLWDARHTLIKSPGSNSWSHKFWGHKLCHGICSVFVLLLWFTAPLSQYLQLHIWNIERKWQKMHEPIRQKTYRRTKAPRVDSDHPAQSRSLIRIFIGYTWLAKDAKFLHADNEDSDQTARMRRLIWVFVGSTWQEVRFLTLWLLWELNVTGGCPRDYHWPIKSNRGFVRNLSFIHVDNEDSDQPERMPRLIRVFAGRTCHLVGFVMWRLNSSLRFLLTLDVTFILSAMICLLFPLVSLVGYVKYSRLPLSRNPRDSMKHFEIFLLRHIRFAELGKTINRRTTFNRMNM